MYTRYSQLSQSRHFKAVWRKKCDLYFLTHAQCARHHLNLLLPADIRLVLGLSIGLKDSGCLDSCRSEGNVESDKGHLLTGRTFSFAPKQRTFNQTKVTHWQKDILLCTGLQTLLVSKYLYSRDQDFQVFLADAIFNQTKATRWQKEILLCLCESI